jgi:hypothetical protein
MLVKYPALLARASDMTGDVPILPRCAWCWAKEHLLKCENDDCPDLMCSAHNYGGRCIQCWETGSIILPLWPLRKSRRI